jgi:hypothetical protein
MTNIYTAHRDGGKSSEEAMFRLLNKIAGANNEGVVGTNDLLVEENGTPDMHLIVNTGDIVIPYQNHFYHNWITVSQTVTVTSNSSGNPRKDVVVAYVDLSVVQSTTSNNPDAMKLIVVAGTPGASPSAPDATAIQAAVGAGNPYTVLAEIAVADGVTSITDANITDLRETFVLGVGVSNVQTLYNKKISKLIAINEYDNGNSGASPNINWANGDRQKITLNNNATFTFSNATEGQVLTLWIKQDGTGGRSITLPAGIKYPGGFTPTWPTGIGDVSVIIIRYDGTNYFAQIATDFS